MALEGIGSSVPLAGVQPSATRPAGGQNGAAAALQRNGARQVQPEAAAAITPGIGSLPAEPPPGTDPELWAVLTSEERVYFARMQSLGPLTYGRGERAPALPRGGRLDVQV